MSRLGKDLVDFEVYGLKNQTSRYDPSSSLIISCLRCCVHKEQTSSCLAHTTNWTGKMKRNEELGEL